MKRKKRAVTLIEIMIVILLIGLIGGALAVNMKGSVDKGREFKTKVNKERVRDILDLALASGLYTEAQLLQNNTWQEVVKESPLANKDCCLDGWGKPLQVTITDGTVTVRRQNEPAN